MVRDIKLFETLEDLDNYLDFFKFKSKTEKECELTSEIMYSYTLEPFIYKGLYCDTIVFSLESTYKERYNTEEKKSEFIEVGKTPTFYIWSNVPMYAQEDIAAIENGSPLFEHLIKEMGRILI